MNQLFKLGLQDHISLSHSTLNVLHGVLTSNKTVLIKMVYQIIVSVCVLSWGSPLFMWNKVVKSFCGFRGSHVTWSTASSDDTQWIMGNVCTRF